MSILLHGPCLCGATDCPKCYPFQPEDSNANDEDDVADDNYDDLIIQFEDSLFS